ncbi:PilZ domain-containing protein [Pseudomonas sp. HLS-6]|uniref:PilZ domain-containing protein n=1 Tax=Pseudomonas sp. HLS-6 TaxID=2049589 RepID=UPI000C1A7075|nr:PilZ domain-containing protein [Pseudomonas sp. HLS-6]ATR81673.1 PilZ domain-containing protein [Pseudomonas sp. HLS-6]
MSDHHERRLFKRVPFDARTELVQGDQRWPVKLLDLSLKGLLIECPEGWQGDPIQGFDASIHLNDHDEVRMHVELRHEEGNQMGFVCQFIDLDSISHLRRLIELNLANPEELERELRQLIEA